MKFLPIIFISLSLCAQDMQLSWFPSGTTYLGGVTVTNDSVAGTGYEDISGATVSNSWSHIVSNNVANAYVLVFLHAHGDVNYGNTNNISADTKVWFGTNQLTFLSATNHAGLDVWGQGMFGAALGNLESGTYTVRVTNELPYHYFLGQSAVYYNANQTNAPVIVWNYEAANPVTLALTNQPASSDASVAWAFENPTSGYDGAFANHWRINESLPYRAWITTNSGSQMLNLGDFSGVTGAGWVFTNTTASGTLHVIGGLARVYYLTNAP